MKGFRKALATLLASVSIAKALTITENTVYEDRDEVYVFSIDVRPDVFFTLLNIGEIRNPYDIQNQGELYMSSTDGSPVYYYQPAGDFINTGIVSVDARSATGTGRITIQPFTFRNRGKLWLGTSNSQDYPRIDVAAANIFENYGQIIVEQVSGTPGNIQLVDGPFNMVNAGAICIKNVRLTQSTTITGSGCIAVGEDAIFQVGRFLNADSSQVFAFTGPHSTIDFTGLSRSYTGTRTYNIVGFGSGKSIGLDEAVTSYDYQGDTLNLNFDQFTIALKIGSGFESDAFSIVGSSSEGYTITYDGPVAGNSEIPGSCTCDPFPRIRTLNEPEPSSSEEPSSTSPPSSSTEESSTITGEPSTEESSVLSETSSSAPSFTPSSSSDESAEPSASSTSSENEFTSITEEPSSSSRESSSNASTSSAHSEGLSSTSELSESEVTSSSLTSLSASASTSEGDSSAATSDSPSSLEPSESSERPLGSSDTDVSTSLNISSSTPEPSVNSTTFTSETFKTTSRTITTWETYCPICPGEKTTLSGYVYTKTFQGTYTVTTELCPPGATLIPPKSTVFTTIINGHTKSGIIYEVTTDGVTSCFTKILEDHKTTVAGGTNPADGPGPTSTVNPAKNAASGVQSLSTLRVPDTTQPVSGSRPSSFSVYEGAANFQVIGWSLVLPLIALLWA